jgi:hypothetical protein
MSAQAGVQTSTRVRRAGITALAFLTVVILFSHSPVVQAVPESTLVMDVAEDLTTFNIAPASTQSGGVFPDGAFYVSGDIYPAGTLLPDGSVPAGAEAIGKWFTYGFISGTAYISTDVYVLNGLGRIITSQAGPLEFVAPLVKAVTGGSGRFAGAGGEVVSERLNPPFSLNSQATFKLTGVKPGR